ncbi:MAG: hypothetical protein ACLFSL_02965, partial [Candidatus Woesearchaeota archaeon]
SAVGRVSSGFSEPVSDGIPHSPLEKEKRHSKAKSKDKDGVPNIRFHTDKSDSDFKTLSSVGDAASAGAKYLGTTVARGATLIGKTVVDRPIQVAEYGVGLKYGLKWGVEGASAIAAKAGVGAAGQLAIQKTAPHAVATAVTGKAMAEQESISDALDVGIQSAVTTATIYGAFRGAQLGRDTAAKVGKQKVPATDVFHKPSLEGKQRFPMARSVQDSQRQFRQASDAKGLRVTHAAPSPLKSDQIGAGPMAQRAREDAGLYVTPEGKGSPNFLKVLDVVDDAPEPQYTLFPRIKRPTAVTVEGIGDVKRLPERLIQQKGFSGVNEYLQRQAPKGDIYITKRSEIAQRGLKGVGKGTGEIEAVIPTGAKIQPTQTTRYTVVQGRTVPIREYSILKGGAPAQSSTTTATVAREMQRSSDSLSRLSQNQISGTSALVPTTQVQTLSEGKKPSEAAKSPQKVSTSKPQSSPVGPVSPSIARSLQASRSQFRRTMATPSRSPTSPSRATSPARASEISTGRPSEIPGRSRRPFSIRGSSITGSSTRGSSIGRGASSSRAISGISQQPPSPPQRPPTPFPRGSPGSPKKSRKDFKKATGRGIYTPSLIAADLKIEGDPDQLAAMTGLGIRPIQKKRK